MNLDDKVNSLLAELSRPVDNTGTGHAGDDGIDRGSFENTQRNAYNRPEFLREHVETDIALGEVTAPPFVEIEDDGSPAHAIVCALASIGMSQRRIRERMQATLGWSYGDSQLRRILRQPWMRKRIHETIAQNAKSMHASVMTLLAEEALTSVRTIATLRDTADSDAVKLSASRDLVDRFLGKPIQRQEIAEVEEISDPSRLDEELARTRAEIARLTGQQTIIPQGSN